jgi:hypothetical protein
MALEEFRGIFGAPQAEPLPSLDIQAWAEECRR